MAVDPLTCARAPKVLLHDHLDGGLRPATLVELARADGDHELPTWDPVGLGAWLVRAADSGSLVRYLETFAHTVAVMQTGPALERVARECVQDLAADGIVYAEVRFAPELHTAGGLAMEAVVAAVLAGVAQGERDAAALGRAITVRLILSAMRTAGRSLDVARLVVAGRGAGVVGFDIAGAEDGYPPTRHQAAFDHVREHFGHITIHAGEAFGLPSIGQAIHACGAERLGHGVRLTDDIRVDPEGIAHLGPMAAYVRDRRIPLEMCPSSNVQTGAVASVATHPVGLLRRLGFRVTVNTDNRLMSHTTLSRELHVVSEAFDYGLADLRWLTINAMKSAFLAFDQRIALIEDVIKPGYSALA